MRIGCLFLFVGYARFRRSYHANRVRHRNVGGALEKFSMSCTAEVLATTDN